MNSMVNNKTARILVKPIVDWKKKRDHETYLRTPDHFYLQTLKGIHEGKRCFIIGNGPSLSVADLDKLQGEYTFAANRIFKMFDATVWRPSYYLLIDDRVMKDVQDELCNYELGHMFLRNDLCTIQEASNKLTRIFTSSLLLDPDLKTYNKTSTYISKDVSNHFCDGKTVTFYAIQLAIYMGFKELYLLGVDHNYAKVLDEFGKLHADLTIRDYFDNKRYNINYAELNSTQYAYTVAREYCDTHGITIRNATRGGKLEVFERVDFDELMAKEEGEKE